MRLEEFKKQIEMQDEGVLDVDFAGIKNPQNVGEFARECQRQLENTEDKYAIKNDFLSFQKEINSNHRKQLIDWLIQVHYKFKLLPETLYIVIYIIDKFSSL